MTYTEATSMTQVSQWMEDGLNVEYRKENTRWAKSNNEQVNRRNQYRLVEPDWQPEVGDMVTVAYMKERVKDAEIIGRLKGESIGKDFAIAELKQEIEVLRQYGNKDCAAMAYEFINKHKHEG